MSGPTDTPSPTSCRSALEAVLQSRTFERSEQLRAFLQFICEEELGGRGAQLNEYQIGVLALGRPQDYSPGEDAIVRNRAHSLRKKLEEYYSGENPGAALRIEVPRGSYQPKFVRSGGDRRQEADLATRPGRGILALGVAFLAGALTASLVWWMLGGRQEPDPAIRAAWGPLAQPGAQTIVHVSSPLHLFVRPSDTRLPGPRPQTDPEVLKYWFRQHPALVSLSTFFLRPTSNSLLWGDAVGAVTVGRVLTEAGVNWEVWPARVAGDPVLRARNAILFGRPEYSKIAGRLLGKTPFTVEYNSDLQEYAVLERGTGQWWKPEYVADDFAEVVYGLVTVQPSEGAERGGARTVLITGTNSAGIQAAAEYFSSPADLARLQSRFPEGGFPASYQVVVRSRANSTIALDHEYVTHRVIP